MPRADVTKDQFEWVGDALLHTPSGAHFSATTGIVDWAGKDRSHPSDEFDPIDVAFVAGQLLAERRFPKTRVSDERHDGE